VQDTPEPINSTESTDSGSAISASFQKIDAYNAQVAEKYLLTATIFIAFLAGILTLLSPCILPLIPVFFSYSFGTKKEITKMTLFFFAGSSLMFITIAMLAVFVGTASIIMFQLQSLTLYTRIIGILLIVVGILGVLGIGFKGINLNLNTKKTAGGVFAYGALFAVGWTACIGPILSGVILMASVFQNYWLAALLIFFYSFGVFLPLIIISVFWDKRHLEKAKWLKGRMFTYRLNGRKRTVHSSSLISGAFFIIIGAVFAWSAGTGFINGTDFFGTKMLFYEWQPLLLENAKLFNIIGAVVLTFTILLIIWGLRKKK